MSTNSSVYLCGPITGQSFEAAKNGWRRDVFHILHSRGITCYSPLRHLKPEQLQAGDLEAMNPQGAEVGVLSTPRGLTERDRFDVLNSSIILCNMIGATKISAGSMIELGWADTKRIPILLCMEDEGNPNDHGMVRALASWIVPTLEEGIQVVTDLLIPSV